jgi:hypothetical protein
MTKNTTCETIGCDIGDKTSEICVLRRDGSKVTWICYLTNAGSEWNVETLAS